MELDFRLDPTMHIRIHASVNGTGPHDFHVDTGARATTISRALAEQLKIETYEEERERAGITYQTTLARLDNLRIGTDEFVDEEVLVMDLHKMFGPSAPYGNVGYTTLKHYVFSVNYTDQKLRLEREEPKGIAEWIDFQYVGGSHLVGVPTIVNGKGPYELIIETGSGITILSPELANDLELGGNMQEVMVRGVEGQTTAHFASIDSLSVGKFLQKNLQVIVMDLGSVARSGGLIKDGAIGYNFLKSFETIIDYPNMRISFVPKGHN
ncbi:MAG: retropepsin-like domain-containing protein [Candidatus Thorarchaeota archaeon]|nr:MAG: retropepsin-like domain-containing protein [Candidatus Thorarchaeota archaeon]